MALFSPWSMVIESLLRQPFDPPSSDAGGLPEA
jgi:hypothetical protein